MACCSIFTICTWIKLPAVPLMNCELDIKLVIVVLLPQKTAPIIDTMYMPTVYMLAIENFRQYSPARV